MYDEYDYYQANAVDSLATTIYEQDPQYTGLLDKDGYPIMKFSDQIGFIRS